MKKILLLLFLVSCSVASFSQALILTNPAKGNVWPAFSIQRIEWTSTNIDNIKIDCSLDSGRTWTIIESSYPASAEYYDWTVVNKVSDSCYIRITDINSSTSSSNYKINPFKIPSPGITLDTLPAAVFAGTAVPITWVSSGIKKANLYVSYNNQTSFKKIADTITATNFYYNWIVPDSTATNCFLKIESAEQNSLTATTATAFAINRLAKGTDAKFKGGSFDGHTSSNNISKKILLTTLNKPDSLFGNTVYTIKWQQNNVDLVNLYYSSDNGANWQSIIKGIPASSSKYDWTVVNTPTNLGRIKVTDASDSSFMDISDSAFIIRNKILQITSPDTSSTAYKNTALSISWISGGVSNLRISLLSNNKVSVLVDSIPAANESFNWIIKQGAADSFRLLISDRLDSTVKDTSVLIILKTLPTATAAKYHGGSFDGHTMAANTKSKIQLLYPNGGEALSVLNNYTIKWRATNIEHIGLDLSLDSGKTWKPMVDSLAASAYTYTWKTPNSPSPNCFLRIRDELDSSVYDITDSVFVLSTKKLLNTTDSTNWIRGTAKSIEWQPLGIETIRILYKTSINANWNLLKDSVVASNEILNWILPTNLSDSLWIRMVDITDSTVKDDKVYFGKMQNLVQSFSPTKYHGGSFDGHTQRSNINKIIIKHPDANEVLIGGVIYNISWTTINLEDTVLLQYSIDSGATWVNITSTPAQSGVYQWTVPATYTTNSIVPKTIELPGLQNNSITSKTIGLNELTTFGTSNALNSNKCQIRALDVSAGNIPVGTSNKTFSIYSSAVNKKIDTLIFPQPADLIYGQSNSQVLQAKASSNREVKYIIKSGNALLSGNTITVSQAGKIIVGAYVTTDSSYYPLDTLFTIFCANPISPIVSNITYCQNTVATSLIATALVGDTLRWCGLNAIGGAGTITAPVPSTSIVGSTDYYVSQYIAQGCESSRSKLTVTINAIPTAPIVANVTYYQNALANPLSATALSGDILKWYGTNANGGTGSITAPIPLTSILGSTDYYVSQYNPQGCESSRSKLTVSINATVATTISSFNPSTAIAGTKVTITGANLTGATAVTFGGIPASSFIVVSSTSITAVVGTGSTGNISVNTPLGTATLAGFNFVPMPTITAAGPTTFITGGNTVLSANPGTGFNYQWIKDGVNITSATGSTYTATQSGSYSVSISLNTISQLSTAIVIKSVFSLPSNNFKITNTSAACKGSANGSINIIAAQHLNYTATFVTNGLTTTYSFTDSININNLTAGSYTICLTVAGQSTYQQYFTTVITEPKDLSLFMVVKPGNQLVITLDGANTYSINLNGTIYTTTESQIVLPLANGNNTIQVTTDKACQGVIERNITVSENVLAYPNPFDNTLNLNLGKNDIQTAMINVISVNGDLVYSTKYTHPSSVIKLDLSKLAHGLYMLTISTDHLDTVIKILKK